MRHNDIHDIEGLKTLLDKYFDATLSPTEMERLELAALEVAEGRAHCPDPGLAADLHLINSISAYGTALLQNAGDSIPAGLEQRLNAHISHLASQSSAKRHGLARRITYFCAAAAAAAIVATAGFIYFSSTAPIPSEEILIANATHSPSVEKPTLPAQTATATKTTLPPQPAVASVRIATHTHMKKPSGKKENATPLKFQQEADKALKGLPSFAQDALAISEDAFQVMPSGIEAYVETSQLLVMPISTFSQSINNIYESVEIVSEAFSGVTAALDAANNSLALLSNPLGYE